MSIGTARFPAAPFANGDASGMLPEAQGVAIREPEEPHQP